MYYYFFLENNFKLFTEVKITANKPLDLKVNINKKSHKKFNKTQQTNITESQANIN